MNNIGNKERRYLKGKAHHIEAIVIVGKNGINNGVISSIKKALEARELIKIRFRGFKDNKEKISKQIARSTESNIVAIIGHTLILFKQNLNPDKRYFLIK